MSKHCRKGFIFGNVRQNDTKFLRDFSHVFLNSQVLFSAMLFFVSQTTNKTLSKSHHLSYETLTHMSVLTCISALPLYSPEFLTEKVQNRSWRSTPINYSS